MLPTAHEEDALNSGSVPTNVSTSKRPLAAQQYRNEVKLTLNSSIEDLQIVACLIADGHIATLIRPPRSSSAKSFILHTFGPSRGRSRQLGTSFSALRHTTVYYAAVKMDTAAIRRRRRRRVADENRKRAPRACDRCKARKSKCIESTPGACQRCSQHNMTCRQKTPPLNDDGPSQASLTRETPPTGHAAKTPEESISIDSHQTERVLWPSFLSRLREAFSLDSQTAPEERDMVAMQAHITRPTILQPSELARLQQAIDAFPPRPVADFLVSFYTDPATPLRSDCGFVCLALATFALASQWTLLERPEGSAGALRPDDGDPGRIFYNQAKLLIPDVIDRPDLRSIQAPFVIGVYLLPASAIGSSYVYMGLAMRKAMAFDLHQNIDDQSIDEREREVRRRLTTTIKLNRPRSISAEIITTPLPSPLPLLDRMQKFDNIQYQIAYARLVVILDRAAEPGNWMTDTARPMLSTNTERDLKEWKKSLPPGCNLKDIHPRDSAYRAVFHLYLSYYYTWIAMGKVSLVTVARAKLRYHLGHEAQPPVIDETVDRLSKSCIKAARKLLILLENLKRTGNITRFSFTDFQGCSIATIVTLVAGILERDSAYEATVTFGLDCLRSMAAGNITAKMGVKFVEALQSITNEAVEKLCATSTFGGGSGAVNTPSTSEYNQWAEWFSKQDRPPKSGQTTPLERDTMADSIVPTVQDDEQRPMTQPSIGGWGFRGEETVSIVSTMPHVFPQQPTVSQSPATDNDFLSALYNEDQTFLMGLTGLDVLDFSGFTTQL
ncbi:hypothetical protein G7046_g126 [Stylonectria norvegica]|nr:hypothetical protein G7046_g126 [Stylonectria norvegica]